MSKFFMSAEKWDLPRLQQMITDKVEESLSLDYKAAGALTKGDAEVKAKWIEEITKDVSAMANADGGVIIYGIAEGSGKKQHLPVKIDPLRRDQFSKERLEQIIQTVRPRIEGLVVHVVLVSEEEGTVCYVVEIPKSSTGHMARDHRYHMRHNFTTVEMEDFQVRDVMNRGKRPSLKIEVRVDGRTDGNKIWTQVAFKITNTSSIVIKDWLLFARFLPPLRQTNRSLDTTGFPSNWDIVSDTEHIAYWFRTADQHPLFPSLAVQREVFFFYSGNTNYKYFAPEWPLIVRAYADDMPTINGEIRLIDAVQQWTPVKIQ